MDPCPFLYLNLISYIFDMQKPESSLPNIVCNIIVEHDYLNYMCVRVYINLDFNNPVCWNKDDSKYLTMMCSITK